MKSHSVSLAVDEFATGRADALILIGRILLAWVFVGSAYGAISNLAALWVFQVPECFQHLSCSR